MGRWTLKRVEDAFTGFFSRVGKGGKAGYPRFKPISRWSTFGLLEIAGLRLDGDRIRLKGMDRPIRLSLDRPLPADARLLGATFIKEAGHWYLGLTFESASIAAATHARVGPEGLTDADVVGLDLGIEALATLSTGERIANARPTSRREREIRVSRRALTRCKKGSARRRKVKAALGRKLKAVADARTDHLHKVSARLAN